MVGFANEWLHDCSCDFWVIERCQRVADVVNQRAEYVLVIAVVALGAGCCLQAVLQPVDGETAVIDLQVGE